MYVFGSHFFCGLNVVCMTTFRVWMSIFVFLLFLILKKICITHYSHLLA